MPKNGPGRPRNPEPEDKGVVGFRLPIPRRQALDLFLLEREQAGLPLATKQDLFEWLTERLLAGRLALPKRTPATATKGEPEAA